MMESRSVVAWWGWREDWEGTPGKELSGVIAMFYTWIGVVVTHMYRCVNSQ